MKEQENSPEEQPDEMDASNLSDGEFPLRFIRILNSIEKDIKKQLKRVSEIKNAVSEIIHWKK